VFHEKRQPGSVTGLQQSQSGRLVVDGDVAVQRHVEIDCDAVNDHRHFATDGIHLLNDSFDFADPRGVLGQSSTIALLGIRGQNRSKGTTDSIAHVDFSSLEFSFLR
jgi:hypothetical protein